MQRTLIGLVLALLPLGAAAQQAPLSADGLAVEVARVNATLKEIVTLLKRQSDIQSLDLLVKRVQLSDSQVAEQERRLRSAESELRNLEREQSSNTGDRPLFSKLWVTAPFLPGSQAPPAKEVSQPEDNSVVSS